MAGTATAYSAATIHQGPADIWIIGGGVVDSATPQLTIATDGTPDATAHPASVHLGYTEAAVMMAYTPKIVDITADQAPAAIARYGEVEKMTISAELKQLDLSILQQCAGMGVYSTATGYTQLTFGGITAVPSVCVAMICAKRGAAGKFIVGVLFAATGQAGLGMSFGRAKSTFNKVEFEGLADMSRVSGRQIGVYYVTK